MCSGSVAALKDLPLWEALKKLDMFNIQFVYTKPAQHFSYLLPAIANPDNSRPKEDWPKVWLDSDEWKWSKIGDPVIHIELRKWADMYLIAPLSCNTMAKIANGMCDNLLTCVVRACDMNSVIEVDDMILQCTRILKKPIIVCPAMNTMMYDNVFTYMHYKTMKDLGIIIVDCISKNLACGDVGKGAMENVPKIVKIVKYIAEEYLLQDFEAKMQEAAEEEAKQ
jgi:phosphopantothenoylcysteine decarboxylase